MCPAMRLARLARPAAAFLLLALPMACMKPAGPEVTMAAQSRLPVMRWDHRPEAADWTRATLSALREEGAVLAATVPVDVRHYCPGYAGATADERAAFWSGLLSALAKYESTWNPAARGGGGRWLGLMQIAPSTAQAYGCELPSDKGLHDGSANLACAVRIAARQVGRDGAIVSDGSGGWRGVARDWAPMRAAEKRAEIAAWTSAQSYCRAET